ncbi:hypothetical protein CTI12_AA611410 [Artemisia annua]|uniref:TATA-binding protein interacting (TIP20) domain-containing protein n=1 Tax=Artemisia annua TaxID=35608 RepID=A0A2U1KEP4_ARTAN|nr:hypothetical protein CTI12_AA611410 [Artemisia annua]
MSNDHGARGTHPRGNGRHYIEHSNLNQSMDSLKLSSNTDHLPTPAQRQSQIVAGNPMAGQNVGKGSTSVKGGIELGRGGRSAIVKNMSVKIAVPQNVIGSVYGENGTNLARQRHVICTFICGFRISDHYDVKMSCHLILSKLADNCPSSVLAVLDSLVDPLQKTVNFRPKQDAVKQEVDRNEDMIRSALRAISSLNHISGGDCSH